VRLGRLLTGDFHEGEDLAQTGLVKLYLAWPRVRAEGADAYARRILVNAYLDRVRGQRLRIVPMADPPEPAHRPGTDPGDSREALLQALAELPPRMRAAVLLRCWEDLSEDAVATALGCSRGTVKSQLSRALAKLRAHPALAGLEPMPLDPRTEPRR
jgi:RNA polymerase sigma-70 factor (sigma-E family)